MTEIEKERQQDKIWIYKLVSFTCIAVTIVIWAGSYILNTDTIINYHVISNNKLYNCKDYIRRINAVEFYKCTDKNNNYSDILYLAKNNLTINRYEIQKNKTK